MKFNQEKRINKVAYEPFYLLSLEENGNYVFDVSGSTANIYRTTLYKKQGGVFCNCPDAKSWAKRQGCICKHACFVFLKVLKIPLTTLESHLFDHNLQMSSTLRQQVASKFQQLKSISLKHQEFVNQEFLEKYEKIKNEHTATTTTTTTKKSKYEVKKELDNQEAMECMICFDEMDIKEKETLVECPLCHNLIHKVCMEKWLKSGKKNCIYCRSDVWKNYGKENKPTNTDYKNLLDS